MKEKIQSRQTNIIMGVLFLITMFIACSPLFTENCINGHDIEYHLLRIESLKEGILMGKPFLKVNVLFLGGAGYASSMFYPDFLLYIPALLRVLGVNINASFHIFVEITFILCYGITYYCTKYITKSSYAASVAAVVLTLCQYHMDDVYIRSAVGEYTALIFIPLVIAGIYDVFYKDMEKPWLLGIGMGGVLLCHSNSFVMCIGLCILFMILRWKVWIHNVSLILKLIITTVTTLLITMFYWLPMLEQMISTTFHVSTAWIMPDEAMREVSSIFTGIFPAVGIAVFLINLPRIMLSSRSNQENTAETDIEGTDDRKKLLSFSTILMVAGILFALAATRLFPWEVLGKYLLIIQFPWRLYLLASACLTISGAVILYLYFTSEKTREYTLLFVICVMAFSAFSCLEKNEEGYYSYSNDYFAYEPFTFHIIGGEWLPESVTDVEAIETTNDTAVTEDGTRIKIGHNKNAVMLDYPGSTGTYIDVPLIYYKGYTASLTTVDQKETKLQVTGEGQNGYCRVLLTGDEPAGLLTVYYKGTIVQNISYIISVLTLIGLFGYGFWVRKKGNSRQEEGS